MLLFCYNKLYLCIHLIGSFYFIIILNYFFNNFKFSYGFAHLVKHCARFDQPLRIYGSQSAGFGSIKA